MLLIVCGYQYTQVNDANERLNSVHGIAKDAMAASLQETVLSIELLQLKDKEFVIGFLTDQAHAQYRNVINYPKALNNSHTVMVQEALKNYTQHFSGASSETGL